MTRYAQFTRGGDRRRITAENPLGFNNLTPEDFGNETRRLVESGQASGSVLQRAYGMLGRARYVGERVNGDPIDEMVVGSGDDYILGDEWWSAIASLLDDGIDVVVYKGSQILGSSFKIDEGYAKEMGSRKGRFWFAYDMMGVNKAGAVYVSRLRSTMVEPWPKARLAPDWLHRGVASYTMAGYMERLEGSGWLPPVGSHSVVAFNGNAASPNGWLGESGEDDPRGKRWEEMGYTIAYPTRYFG